jgi:hypothetical protein
METLQTHCYATVTHVTIETPSRPNMSQYLQSIQQAPFEQADEENLS